MKNKITSNLFNPKGAGRPKKSAITKEKVAHATRELLPFKKPLHVTLRLVDNLPTIRNKMFFSIFKNATLRAKEFGIRVLHYSIQKNHLHLILEADNNEILSKSMQSLCISLAKQIKKMFKLSVHKIFRERFHLHVLKTVTEVRNAIAYVSRNAFKHKILRTIVDLYSSACLLKDFWQIFFPGQAYDIDKLKINTETKEKYLKEVQNITDFPCFWISFVGVIKNA